MYMGTFRNWRCLGGVPIIIVLSDNRVIQILIRILLVGLPDIREIALGILESTVLLKLIVMCLVFM